VPNMKKANAIEKNFKYLAKRFGIKIKVIKTQTEDPVGKGVGPALEARDVLRVLQQRQDRPGDLENKAIHLAGELLELIGKAKLGEGPKMAWTALESGRAWKAMQSFIKAQGGVSNRDPNSIVLSAHKKYINASKSGIIKAVDNKSINSIARILGAPTVKLAGIYLNKEAKQKVKKGERLYTLYAENPQRMKLAVAALDYFNFNTESFSQIFEILFNSVSFFHVGHLGALTNWHIYN